MPDLTRRQLALIIGAALAVITLAVGVYGLATGPGHGRVGASAAASPAALSSMSAPTIDAADMDPDRKALPRTNDPIVFARAVALALFDWDTAAGYMPADYQAPVLADADPSGEEAPGLISDIATYMPTVDQWLDLATMNVTQTLTIDSAAVPADWQSIVAQAHGQLRPGTTAVTITGVRHRSGVWDGENATTASPVSFTVFVACQPACDRCRVLRLSQLDDPLK
jgi:hypothetical protein